MDNGHGATGRDRKGLVGKTRILGDFTDFGSSGKHQLKFNSDSVGRASCCRFRSGSWPSPEAGSNAKAASLQSI
jgi:hypothetical protein